MNLDEYRAQREERNQRELDEIRTGAASMGEIRDIKNKNKKEKRIKRRRSSLFMLLLGVLLGALVSATTLGILSFISKSRSGDKKIVVDGNGMKSEEEMGELREDSHLDEIASVEDITEVESYGDDKGNTGALETTDASAAGDGSVKNYSPQESATALSVLQQSLENGEGMLNSLRKAFTGQLIVVRDGDFFFRPIDDTLKKNDYDVSKLSYDEKNRLVYTYDDGTTSKTGVDVSRYQGDIDWEKVRNDGIDFAIIRGGIRGYESGKLVPEEDFVENALEASGQNLEIGVYFFSQAVNTEEAVEEADCIIEALGGNEISYPVIFDLERINGGRMSDMTQEEMTDCALAFCDRIRQAGYTPMIYGNLETFTLMLDMTRLEDIDKWLAYYVDDFYFPYSFRLWQYTEKGTVDGIEGKVDMDVAFY